MNRSISWNDVGFKIVWPSANFVVSWRLPSSPLQLTALDCSSNVICHIEKKRREAQNAHQKRLHQQSNGFPTELPSVSSINSDSPEAATLAPLRSPLTKVPNAISTDFPMTAFAQGMVNTDIDLDTVDPSPRESNNEPFHLPITPGFQFEFMAPYLDPTTVLRTLSPQQFDNSFTEITGGYSDSWPGDSREEASLLPSELSLLDTHHGPPLSDNDGSISGLIISNNEDGWISSLHIAAQGGHEQIVQALLQHNTTDINKVDSDGRTALIHAVVENNMSVVLLLLEKGARMGASDCDGRSALHWAVLYRRVEILDVLLKHREEHEASFDIDTHDSTGWTPLHMAVNRAFEPGVLMLIQSGADDHAKANQCPYTGNIMPLLKGQQ